VKSCSSVDGLVEVAAAAAGSPGLRLRLPLS
jgi:hypothetical protein